MKSIYIDATPTTPEVKLDHQTGLLEIKGKSLPENSFEFYKPILEWIEEYVEHTQNESTLVFKLEYFNTSSTAHFLRIIKKLEKLYKDGKVVVVQWFYDGEDEDMREAGNDFQLLVKMPIEIIATNSLH